MLGYDVMKSCYRMLLIYWQSVIGPTNINIHAEDGGSQILRNVDILPQQFTASKPRRPRFEYTF